MGQKTGKGGEWLEYRVRIPLSKSDWAQSDLKTILDRMKDETWRRLNEGLMAPTEHVVPHDESDDGPAHGRPAGGQEVEAVLQSGHHQRGVAVHVVTGEVETLKGKRRV